MNTESVEEKEPVYVCISVVSKKYKVSTLRECMDFYSSESMFGKGPKPPYQLESVCEQVATENCLIHLGYIRLTSHGKSKNREAIQS